MHVGLTAPFFVGIFVHIKYKSPAILDILKADVVLGIMHIYTCTRRRLPEKLYGILGCIGPVISFVYALVVFFQLKGMPADTRFLVHNAFTWFKVGDLNVTMGFLADPLSSLMLLFVTFIGSLIHIYSVGYMAGDENFGKFFSYMNLFLGSMVILVLGSGPVVMFIGWEGVGLCSYLLISYYSKDTNNVLAGNKAFIVNRIGDLGFVLGMAFLFWAIGSGGFGYLALRENAHLLTPAIGLTVCLLLFIGACGKSAQIPLYVWLPDAMAGPTPVSALIHAATMVTAGVYMVARFSFIYAHVPLAGEIVAWTGILTALLAAIQARDKEVVSLLIEAGCDVNAQTDERQTALMQAARRGHLEIVRILLEAGGFNYDAQSQDLYRA